MSRKLGLYSWGDKAWPQAQRLGNKFEQNRTIKQFDFEGIQTQGLIASELASSLRFRPLPIFIELTRWNQRFAFLIILSRVHNRTIAITITIAYRWGNKGNTYPLILQGRRNNETNIKGSLPYGTAQRLASSVREFTGTLQSHPFKWLIDIFKQTRSCVPRQYHLTILVVHRLLIVPQEKFWPQCTHSET